MKAHELRHIISQLQGLLDSAPAALKNVDPSVTPGAAHTAHPFHLKFVEDEVDMTAEKKIEAVVDLTPVQKAEIAKIMAEDRAAIEAAGKEPVVV